MQLPAWANRHPWLLSMGACLVAGVMIGWLANALPQPSKRSVANAGWHLPDKTALDRYHAANFQTLVHSNAWQAPPGAVTGGSVSADEATKNNTSWTLVGIVTGAGSHALILPADGGETLRLQVGDKLPDGAVITHINNHSIAFVSAGCVQRLPLYPAVAGSASTKQPCKPVADSKRRDATAGDTHE